MEALSFEIIIGLVGLLITGVTTLVSATVFLIRYIESGKNSMYRSIDRCREDQEKLRMELTELIEKHRIENATTDEHTRGFIRNARLELEDKLKTLDQRVYEINRKQHK